LLASAAAQSVQKSATKPRTATHAAAKGVRPKFRPSKGAAGQEAARLGALAGNGCKGKADMPRNDHQWIVLCSNGKTYLVETPGAYQSSAPAVECSLAGIGPLPACFGE
jgi:hypothetical protein